MVVVLLKCVTFILYLLNKSYPFSQLYWLYEYPPWKCRGRRGEKDVMSEVIMIVEKEVLL